MLQVSGELDPVLTCLKDILWAFHSSTICNLLTFFSAVASDPAPSFLSSLRQFIGSLSCDFWFYSVMNSP